MSPRVVITTLARGGWYPHGVARMIRAFHEVSDGYEIQAWINTLPPGAPTSVIENGTDYTGYCAKPFAVRAAFDSGADIVLWLDASFWPVAHIQPLIDHITKHGYYLCRNGNKVGQWASDRCLEKMCYSRDHAMFVEEVSSGCVGFERACGAVDRWCAWSAVRNGALVAGYHTNGPEDGKRTGFVSADPRVLGHRHDQTILSLVARGTDMNLLVERPKFWQYDGQPTTKQTLLLCRGM